MTCRAVLSWMLITASAAHLAHGQTPRRQTLADRMAAIGRSWTQDDSDDGQPNSQPNITEGHPSRGRFPQIDARSLLPTNLFGGNDDHPPTTVPPPPSMHRSAHPGSPRAMTSPGSPAVQPRPPAAGTPPVRTASRPRAGSIQERNPLQDSFTLPGLGGSRLPSSAVKPTDSPTNSSTNDDDFSREITRDYPDVQPNRNVEATSPTRSLNSASSSNRPRGANGNRSAATTSGARQSPQRRAPMHIDPEELRRELAGAFPTVAPTNSSADDITSSDEKTPTPEPASGSSFAAPTSRDPEPGAKAQSEIAGAQVSQSEKNNPFDIPSQSTDVPFTLPVAEEKTSPSRALEIVAPTHPATSASPDVAPRETTTTKSQTRGDGATIFGDPPTVADPDKFDESDISFGFSRSKSEPTNNLAPSKNPAPAMPSAARRREAFGEVGRTPINDPGVLVSHQTPVITTDIRGPKQILVDREATYRVRLQNQGQIPAEGIIANIRIPAGADIVDTTTTHGTIGQSQEAQTAGNLEWQLTRLEAGANETLDIRLVPRSSRPLELGISWTLAPVGSRAVVEVQEPKLRLHVSGPDEVLFGKPQLYRLTLTNPGTGVAEGVTINLLPPGGGDDAVTSHQVGDLNAGTSQSIEVELTAREAGKLFVKAVASAAGGLSSDATKEVFCRKPELEVDWRGPETKYTGTAATHFLRVRNPGTAPAENVTVTVILPQGAELVSASEGQTFNATRGELAWRVGSLGPGDDYYMELKCLVSTPGKNEMKITAATAAGDLTDTHVAETNVVALADLKLEVSDPQGPIAVGNEAIYEICVKNRGLGAAKDVNVVALFSEGVDPVTVEGAMYSVADGRVSFRAIDDLPPGKQIVLRIRANARQAGTHIFRAEVLCRDLDIKLAAEETTRFYADEVFDSSMPADSAPATSAGQPQSIDQPHAEAAELGDRYQTETR